MNISANIIDLHNRRIYPGTLGVADGRIVSIQPTSSPCDTYILPGFIDAHVHVESSMLTPSNFAAAAVVHGTVASVNDPHEIANVLGVEGVQFMLRDAQHVPFKFAFGCPSCVPATTFETAGSTIDVEQTRQLLADPRIGYLSEMMNWPGVLQRDPQVMAKINAALALNKPVDGHAPGLRNHDAASYHATGISTDHECFTLDEALDKLDAGAKILIREGSAARNLDALWTLIDMHPGRIMLCSDDKHPNDLVRGHINQLCARLIANGCDLFNILNAACVVPIDHYKLPVGLLRSGEPADFVEVADLKQFNVLRTWIDGQLVAEGGRSLLSTSLCLEERVAESARPGEGTHVQPNAHAFPNNFECAATRAADFHVPTQPGELRVIAVHDGQIVTANRQLPATNNGSSLTVADPSRDLLKITVVNRYRKARPAVGFVHGFGLKHGAIAGSVAHDSHNIIAVGADDEALAAAVNAVIEYRGGLAVADGNGTDVLPLPIAGLMSDLPCARVAETYDRLEAAARSLGSGLHSPFMTLSFMALLVIPALKLSDRGLFDAERFAFTPLFCG
jgi:adenine deaminase